MDLECISFIFISVQESNKKINRCKVVGGYIWLNALFIYGISWIDFVELYLSNLLSRTSSIFCLASMTDKTKTVPSDIR